MSDKRYRRSIITFHLIERAARLKRAALRKRRVRFYIIYNNSCRRAEQSFFPDYYRGAR